ncbi:hypothetical protein [Helicobacter pylori]|uniref:hypothetical protein n=1 Tax=Helicobacter pylori TaxID=210 RepID=UPI000386668B|nr:hypothetical protein [Helicobacter pylori]EPZ72293.1 hypothetical protein N203_03250 [Helicobacter pylori UM084]
MRLTPRISKSDSQNFNEYFYSKNDSFKVVGGYFAMNTPFNPQLTPLKTLVKIQPKLFIKLAQKTLSLRAQDASTQPLGCIQAKR